MDDFLARVEMRRKKRERQRRRRLIFLSVIALVCIVCCVSAFEKALNSEPERSVAELPPETAETTEAPVSQIEKLNITNVVIDHSEPDPSASAAPVIYSAEYPQQKATAYDLLTEAVVSDNSRVCYLTFDNGPSSSVTPQILDILRRYGVKATFFTVGSLTEQNPDMVRRIYSEGHLVGSRSYSNDYTILYADDASFMQDVKQSFEFITAAIGTDDYMHVFRFPDGDSSDSPYASNKPTYKSLLEQNGIHYAGYTCYCSDTDDSALTNAQLLDRVKRNVRSDDAVILLQDSAANNVTAETLPSIIEYLISRGYEFRRLDEV